MSQSGRQRFVGTLLGQKHGISARADIEWERIMVQITFAFVIILGYLLSVGMSEAKQLAAESEKYRKTKVALESLLSDLRESDIGEERAKRVAAERELQLQKLLSTWALLRGRRPLNQLLNKFSDADLVPLSDDLESLPTGADFQVLIEEVDRVFLSDDQKVAVAEVGGLGKQAWGDAGIEQEAVEAGLLDDVPKGIRELYSEMSVANRENCETLALQIQGDLTRERKQAVDSQYALVQKIADKRVEKVSALPLEVVDGLDANVDNLGQVMLEEILEDLRNTMKLLPETATRIRGLDEPAVDADQE